MAAKRADGPDLPDWPGPKRAPGPVTDKFGRIGSHRRSWRIFHRRRMSETPPSSGRKAAWLIVAMASVVLVVLVFGAVGIHGPNGPLGRVDAFPGLPTGGLLTTQPPETDRLAAPQTTSRDAEPRTSTSQTQPDTGTQTPPLEPPSSSQPPDPQPLDPSESPPTNGPPPPSSTGGAPSSKRPGEDVDMTEATRRFFDLLPEDIDAAWRMMSPRDRQPDFAEFNRVWRRYREVEVLQVTAGADATTVVATVLVTEHRGTSATQRWRLAYRRGGPIIDELVLLDPDQDGYQPFN